MSYDGAGVQFTANHEGVRYKAYQDTGGVWTCGYGHTSNVGPSSICDDALAKQWLLEDTQIAVNTVNRLVKVDLTQNEFNALVDFVYNVGSGNFAKSTLLDVLNEGNYASAASQFLQWKYCRGVVVAGLLNRRNDEKNLFNKPDSEN